MDDKTAARMEALDRAVRVSLANGGHESTEATVKRADEFHQFLTRDDGLTPVSEQQPTVGRIVHYTESLENLDQPHAAIITGVYQDPAAVSLFVMGPTGTDSLDHVRYSDTPVPGHWSWPPRT